VSAGASARARLLDRSEAARLATAAGLLALSFPPLPFGLVALVALTPLFSVLDHDPRPGFRRGFLHGAFFGALFYLVLLFWFWDLIRFTPLILPSWFLTALWQGALMGLAIGAAQWLRVRTGRSVALFLPFAWLLPEKLFQYGDLRFTWGVAANALASHPLLIQTADLWGALGVSFLIVCVNGLLYEAWKLRTTPGRTRPLAMAGVIAAGVLAYGLVRWTTVGREDGESVRVAVIQPDIPQEARDDPARAHVEKARLFELSRHALARNPDLVVWPETAAPWLRYDPDYLEDLLGLCCRVAGASATPFLVGALDAEDVGAPDEKIFNAAFLISAAGEITGIYRKVLLVPMTEHVPYASVFGLLKPERWSGRFASGPGFVPLHFTARAPGPQGDVAVGVPICYEITFPQAIRGFREGGARLIVTITNDAWFGRTPAPFQHFAQVRLRAIENRVAVARAANTGISGFVGPRGDVLQETGIFEPGFLVADLPLAGEPPPYSRWGDWIVPGAWLGLGGYLAASALRRRSAPGSAAAPTPPGAPREHASVSSSDSD
jgi:apolipoprotein N-acyltransferase